MFSSKTLNQRRKIINFYVIDKKSAIQISKYCNISLGTVYSVLKASRVRMRRKGRVKNQKSKQTNSRQEEIKIEDLLYYLYIFLNLKRRDLAELFQCSESKIDKELKKYKITKRNVVTSFNKFKC